jgi:dihydrofolate synthase/folylpolyglutamate synthase
MERACADAGHPERLECCIVTGTNGKGSVCAMMSEALRLSGRRVGLLTSPHIESFNERIQVGGKNIPCSAVSRMATRVRPLAERRGLTYFEAVTLMAFEYFREQKADYAVLEVGVGGRLDAANVAPNKLAVITNVDYDHMDLLGGSLEEIAAEKSGIIKPGSTVVTGEWKPGPFKAIKRAASRANARLVQAKPLFVFDLGLDGLYQQQNASVAFTALRELGVAEETIVKAFKRVRWPGRMERFGRVLIDAAHNPAGMRALRESLYEIPAGRVVAVIAAKGDKDYKEMLRAIAPAVDEFVVTQFRGPPGPLPAGRLAAEAGRFAPTEIVKNPVSAVKAALKKTGRNDIVLLTGSIYLIGQVRKWVREHAGR